MIDEVLTLTISVTNVGGSAAIDIEVVDDLPYGLTLLSSNPAYTSYDSSTGKIIWKSNQLGTINPDETKIITLTVKVIVVEYDGIWIFNNVYANWYDEEKTFLVLFQIYIPFNSSLIHMLKFQSLVRFKRMQTQQ